MGKPSKYEKETIVNFNEGEKEASIYTFNADLKRRLAEFSKKYPLLCRLEKSTPEGSVTYVLDKSRLSIRLVPPYSEERRAAARAYAKDTASSPCRAGRILPDLGAFYGQNNGAEPVFSPWLTVEVSDIREAPDGGNACFGRVFPAVMGHGWGFCGEIRTSAVRSDFLIRKKGSRL